MSKATKVQMAELLVGAGFNPQASLRIVGFPQCTALKVTPAPTLVEDKVVVYANGGSFNLDRDEDTVFLQPEVLPIDSYVEFDGEKTIQFAYGKSGIQRQVALTRLSVPTPPLWPQPKFIKLLYPPK